MTKCTVVIFSHPSRLDYRTMTLSLLMARQNRDVDVPYIWTGIGTKPESGNQDVQDFRDLINNTSLIPDGNDLLFLEDDIHPCFNALPYMVERDTPLLMTSFYNPYRKLGLNQGFIFSQAFKLPSSMVMRMRQEEFPQPHPKLQRDGIDQVVHRYLTRWNMPFYQHRSVVQHVGEASTWNKALTLKGNGRRAIDWPGPDTDAMLFDWSGVRR